MGCFSGRRYNKSMPRISLAIVCALAVASTGCLRSTTAIDLKPDGSGTIVQETALSAQALAMVKGLTSGNQAGSGGPTDIFGEEQARKAAESMGVTFVSGEPFKTNELEGYRARFAFDDVTKLKVNPEQSAAGMSGSGNMKQPPFSFSLDRGATSSVLTIQLPEERPGGPKLLPDFAGGGSADKAQAAQAMAMMQMMMRGLFVDISLNVNGRILKSNAPHVDGSRVTLMQIDFDKLLADPTALEKLQSATDLKAIASIPGLKIVSTPKLTIEFAR
jgi:hypothetical protein